MTQRDIKHFDGTRLKGGPEYKELVDSLQELEGFKGDIAKAEILEQLEPVERNLGYLEVWEPKQVEKMDKELHPPQWITTAPVINSVSIV